MSKGHTGREGVSVRYRGLGECSAVTLEGAVEFAGSFFGLLLRVDFQGDGKGA